MPDHSSREGTDTSATKAPSADNVDQLAPTPTRILGRTSYLLLWMGGCISIGTFTMGSSLVGQLNLLQAFMAMVVGCVIIGVGLMVNGAAGNKYGIPFVVQLRSSFGFIGTKLAGLIRAAPAVVWFGFQSWIGAAAINQVVITLFGYSNVVLFFILFIVAQIALSAFGFHGIKWLENIGAVIMILALIYMFFSVINRYGAEIGEGLIDIEGSWGVPFWNATMLFLGIYATMMLNVADYSRQAFTGVRRSTMALIYTGAILPVTMFMGLIGLMVSAATGVVDPIEVFSSAVDNTPLLIISLIFIAVSQVTTNVLNNVVPPVYVLMDLFKMRHNIGVIVVAVLSVATFPWLLVRDDNADNLQMFVETYSAFLGPIFAIMVVDYYFIRRQVLEVPELYDEGGRFSGVNMAGVIATLVGVVVAFSFSDIGWYMSLLPSGIVYYLLMRYWKKMERFGAVGATTENAAGSAS
ncbi:MAG TPA: NCS1 family transporter [Candidatus Nesterenkonia stercoripullorum]|uniref:NCS1 family transporter n=1 Tax=Candidatus Nesterenkonia stercoripullorum TaxID=2838701 RepID=A0A9D2A8U0_9MICC|nr:NCS1 family transporter [Candidatus Nesterenkonia stercoripullorum]